MKTDSERLEESQPKPGQDLRLESLKERKKNYEKTETHMETNIEKPTEEKKGNNPFSGSVADRTNNGKKIPIKI